MRNNNHSAYFFRGVSEDEYSFLKEAEKGIWEQVKGKLYSDGVKVGEKELERNRPTFVYSSENRVLAISVGTAREKRSVLTGLDFTLMSDLEKQMYCSMRQVLNDCLEGEKLRKEDWK